MLMVTKPPRPDEFEISIFGPGRGECVLLHLGDNEWCVVDSCIPRGRQESIAVEYLRSFGAVGRVRLIVATHWHDDHIRGISLLLSEAPDALFYCSMALQSKEFLTLVYAASETIPGRSGVDEFSAILKNLESKKENRLGFAVANRLLRFVTGATRPFPVTLEALSPSDSTIRSALTEIRKFIPIPGIPQRRIINVHPNDTSVVLWVKAGPLRVLLGADLEQTAQTDTGWSAIVGNHSDGTPAELFKIPHHGSITSDSPEVWKRMLQPNPVAVVTPFVGGRTRLPEDSDLKRLLGRTPRLFCTVPSSAGRPPRRDNSIERAIKFQVVQRRVLDGQPGHVRVRWQMSDSAPVPNIETFNGAYQVA